MNSPNLPGPPQQAAMVSAIKARAKGKKEIYAEAHLKDMLIQDPRIDDVTNISVDCEKLGLFKGKRIHIIGKVNNELDYKTVEEIVRNHIDKRDKISNELKVGKPGTP